MCQALRHILHYGDSLWGFNESPQQQCYHALFMYKETDAVKLYDLLGLKFSYA